ncbi:MAG: SUMF1/EgtB/PvdO family nonheme iron enzyme [Planctomycetes bacterium]|nr:SUMF1/EgtB/PvdO family nonheme iron enzyme [Planctomycetota bacterium]
MRRRRAAPGFAWLMLAAVWACSAERPREEALPRFERFGILRDLVVVSRPARLGGPFFIDRFESTRADFERWLATRGARESDRRSYLDWNRSGEPELPVVGLDFDTAQRFARWRLGRLPRLDEWRWVASANGRHRLPWGDAPRSTWANVAELGLHDVSPVGAFESGRESGGVYDLVGNAAEWTLSPSPDWTSGTSIIGAETTLALRPLTECERLLSRQAAVMPWRGVPQPLLPLIAIDAWNLPRAVVRGLDAGLPEARRGDQAQVLETDIELRMPRDRRWVLGVRVAADPRGLLAALRAVAADANELQDERSLRALRSFLERSDAGPLMREAWLQGARPSAAATSIERVLEEVFGR